MQTRSGRYVCAERACCKCMFQVFYVLQMYVASVLYRCFKNRSGCCNGRTRMLQMSVSNISSVFSDVCCKCVYLDVACILHICCKYFI
jgi:hypothetical protein